MDLTRLQVFISDLTPAEARIVARLPRQEDGLGLAGVLRGPRSRYSRTLPVTIEFQPADSTTQLRAEAVLTDPCFWTPELPMSYDVEIELRQDRLPIAQAHWTIGLRPLGTARRRLWMEGRNWVLRAVQPEAVSVDDLAACHRLDAALVLSSVNDELLQGASEVGVLVVARLKGAWPDIGQQLRRLARWPAAAMAIIDSDEKLPVEIRRQAPNLLLIQRLTTSVANVAPWAHALLLDHGDLHRLAEFAHTTDLPLLIQRRVEGTMPLEAARAACDTLQRDLAQCTGPVSLCEIAGYVV